MKTGALVLLLAVVLVFLAGCTKPNYTGNYAYNQPQQQGQQQGQYVGGGCGVAPSGSYLNTPVQALKPAGSGL